MKTIWDTQYVTWLTLFFCCRQADGFAAKERVGIEADHRGLLCDENVFELLKKWLGVKEESTRRRRLSKSKVTDFAPS